MITIYTLPTCPKCKIIKTKLMNKNIAFTENQDIDQMRSLGLNSTPALYVENDDKLISDFMEINKYVDSL